MEDLVHVQNVSKTFPLGQKPALNNINVCIPKGKIVGLVGPDGAGKTTLIRLIAGLLLPTSGSIKVAGLNTTDEAESIHEILGYMPQKFGLYEDLTVMQNLNLYADLRNVIGTERVKTFERLFKFTNLSPFKDRLAKDLSGGMKQKLGLACTLIKKPKILALDEPGVGVDPISRRELWQMVFELLDDGISVIWSTSYLDEAIKCNTVLLLNEGHLLYSGPPQDLQKQTAQESFEKAFISILGGFEAEESILSKHIPKIDNTGKITVEAKDLTKKFGNFTAASHINFQIHQGEIFGLLGPNGAGKSTTFKMMCGLLKPTEGLALVNGVDLQQAASIARSQLGYMAQKFSMYGDLSVLQNLNFFSGIYNIPNKERKEIIDTMIELFGFIPYLNEPAKNLPLGFKQRLGLACSIMHHPAVLFLDEPTSGVDPITRLEFWNHIRALVSKGVTIMVTTHFMDEAEYCDRIGLVYRGKIIHMGTPNELKKLVKSEELKEPTLEDAFIALIEQYDKEHPNV